MTLSEIFDAIVNNITTKEEEDACEHIAEWLRGHGYYVAADTDELRVLALDETDLVADL